MKHGTLSILLGLGLATGCAADDGGTDRDPGNDSTGSAEQKQQSLQSAEASSKLLALSNAMVGANQTGRRGNLDYDLELDIEAGIDDFLDGMADAECAAISIDVQSETELSVRFDFSDCALDMGLDGIDGSLSVDISADDEGVDYDYAGSVLIDGVSLDGSWSVDVAADGVAVIAGDVGIVFGDGSGTSIVIDASWKDLDGECPVLDQHIEVSDEEDFVSVDLAGFDMCEPSLCSGGLNIEVADGESSETVTIDSSGISVGDLDVGLSCGEDGDFGVDIDELPDGDEDLGDFGDLPEEESDLEELPDGTPDLPQL